ncbi:Sodium Bile acid symporter family protein [Sporotomaculum syntrophicum]|uniref:Sodium Bile acid symporter family protein n=1 Tax=Sporotomaculum syntrophicum TaxID=182264 RepID=A0A9D2WMT4_9FIRM|nr:arsenic resistance protein [Sporotomaculum syntrophicum]KAF1084300.1 Sodium Bile acid symporter family protein [Sporotomaculum syntrophicum]
MQQAKTGLAKQLFFWPSKNISSAILTALISGFLVGLWIDTTPLKQLLPPIIFMMIYPTMIGFKIQEILSISNGKLLATVMLLNFLLIPVFAYLLGTQFLLNDPQLFAGLAITALLPTSNMTIAFTMLAQGNVTASIKATTLGLLLGSLLAPWYLYLMVGRYVPVDILFTLKTIALLILVPMLLGILTYRYLMQRFSTEFFQQQIKPYLPAASAWGIIPIIFISISMNSPRIASQLDMIVVAFTVQLVFYVINYLIAILVGRKLFDEKDSLSLVFSTVLRNLSISIGLAAAAFGTNAALMVSLAFLIQGQAAAVFMKLNKKHRLLVKKVSTVEQ